MIQIEKIDNSIIVKGIDNGTYPNNGVCEYPTNSLIAVIDDSDMVTFRSAATNDVLFSGLVEDITINGESVTKDSIMGKFDAVSNAPQGGGGGGTVDAYTKSESDAKFATKEYAENVAANSVSDIRDEIGTYVSEISDYTENGKINYMLKNASSGTAEPKEIPFKTVNGQNVLGEGNIEITMPEVVDAYTKEESDAKYGLKSEQVSLRNDVENALGEIAALDFDKANKEDVYTKSEADEKFITEHQSLDAYATKEEVNEKADKNDVYTKSETDGKFATKEEIPTLDGYATQEWVEGKHYLTEHQDISNLATKEEVSEVESKIPTLDGYATEKWVEDKHYITEHQDISGLATKNELKDVENKIPSIDGLASETYVNEAKQELQGKIDGNSSKIDAVDKKVDAIDLTPFATKESLESSKNELENQISECVNDAEYVKEDKKIYLKHDSTTIAEIDTTDFIKDGMVDNVVVEDGYLVITFNTDSGKEAIRISIDKIFNAENYYTKNDVDGKLAVKLDVSVFNEYKGTVYTKEETDGKYQTKQDAASVQDQLQKNIDAKTDEQYVDNKVEDYTYDKETIDRKVAEADNFDSTKYYTKDETYSKAEADEKFLTEHQDISNLATKDEVSAVEGKIPSLDGYATQEWVEDKHYLTEHQSLDDYAKTEYVDGEVETLTNLVNGVKDNVYTKSEADGKFLTEHQDISGLATKEEVDEKIEVVEGKIPTLDGYATEQWVENKHYLTEHQSLDNLATKSELNDVENKIPSIDGLATKEELSEVEGKIPSIDNLATKDELNSKQDVLVSGTNIKTVNGESILGSGNIVVSGGESVDAYTKEESDAKYGTKAEQESLRGDVENALGEIAALGYDKADKSELETKQDKPRILEIYNDKSKLVNVYDFDTILSSGSVIKKENFYKNIDLSFDGVKIGDLIYLDNNNYFLFVVENINNTENDLYGVITFTSNYNISDSISPQIPVSCTLKFFNNGLYIKIFNPLYKKQNNLVSGTNIKTINGESILGSGNIEIQGGDVDLSDYYTKEEADALFDGKKTDYEKEYFTIEALEDGNVEFTSNNAVGVKYSLNGVEWQTVDSSSQSISLKNGDKLRLKNSRTSGYNGTIFKTISRCNVYGNINSMFAEDNFLTSVNIYANHIDGLFDNSNGSKQIVDASNLILPYESLANYCYRKLFYDCKALTKAPELPAITLANYCYNLMFFGCESLTKAPELPALIMKQDCYCSMFQGCKSLTKAPELPATTLAGRCYNSMLYNCESLTKAPELPATTLSYANSCYTYMFYNCKALTKAPELPATTLANECYSFMFSYTNITKAPELPATVMYDRCYNYMFSNCMELKETPVLPATKLNSSSYQNMFTGCSNIKKVICLAEENIGSYGTPSWLSSVSTKGTFVKAKGANWIYGTSGIPVGWTVKDYDDSDCATENFVKDYTYDKETIDNKIAQVAGETIDAYTKEESDEKYPTKQEVNQTYLQKTGEYVKSVTANGGSINFEKGNGTPDVVNLKTINNQSIIGMDDIKVPTDTDIENKVGEYLNETLWNSDDALAVTEIGFWEDINAMNWSKTTLSGSHPQTNTQYFKTINGQSILGQGDIVVSGGGNIDMSDYYTKQQVDNLIPKIYTVTQSEYDRAVIDENAIYLIKEDDNTSGGGDAGGYL